MNCIKLRSWILLWGLIILATWTTLIFAATDQTLEDKAKGKDVVEAVVSKIRKSGIFSDDYEFLRRLAYAETRDGELNTTYMWNKMGGIWNVPEIYLNATKSQNMTVYHEKIETTFKINWLEVVWKDLLKPFYSGLAARLYLAFLDIVIPQKTIDQGNYYDKYYNRKDNYNNNTFINSTDELDNSTKTCSGKMDLVIVLDGSGSIEDKGKGNFDLCRNFVIDLIGSYSLKSVRHGFLIFSSDVDEIFPLDNFKSLAQLKQIVREANYPGERTNTNDGILKALEMFDAGEPRPGVPQVMTIITDGESNPPGVDNIRFAKERGIASFVVGVTDEINKKELEELAYNIPSNVFSLDDFDDLASFFKRLNSETCKAPQKPKVDEVVKDDLTEGQKRFYEYSFPSDAAIFLNVSILQGEMKGYYSFSEENPSAAVYDGVLKPGGTQIQPWEIPVLSPSGISVNDASNTKVFISLEGLEYFNNYVIQATAADRDENTRSTTEDSTTEESTTTPEESTTTPEESTTTPEESTSTEEVSLSSSSSTIVSTDSTEKISTTTDGGATFEISFCILTLSFISWTML